MIYKPEDILMVAKVNKGQLLSDIYKYVPEYLEWLMINHHSFCLDVEKFYKLSEPTPFYKDERYYCKIIKYTEKYIHKKIVMALYLGNYNSETLKKINEEGKLKTNEYFNVTNISPNLNVQYVLNIIKVVGFEPKIIPFVFSDAAIERNNLKTEKYISEDFDVNTSFELSYEEY